MAFGLKLRGMPKEQIHQRVMSVAATLDITHLLNRKPRSLSGGQRQRVAVGRAIVREPAAFLFDEPLSNLDAKLRVTTRSELKRLHQRLRTTTLYVTHDQEEAMTLGDRIVVMHNGIIQQADSPLVTYNSPVNRFVAGFIGMPPMNFFVGTIMMSDGGMRFEERVASPDGGLTLTGKGFCLPVLAPVAACLAARVGQEVILGIRPEHFQVRPIVDGPGAALEFKVNVVEPLGNDMDVYMSTNLNDDVVARVEAQSGLQTDSRTTLYVDLRKVHFFEPGETGMNLSQKNELLHAVA
jgi:multiple sugar transport system ATP-binding protein